MDLVACGNACELEVAKGAAPIVVAESADATFTFSVTNVTLPARDLTVTSLSDNVLGSLPGQGDCPAVPFTLASGDTLSCPREECAASF